LKDSRPAKATIGTFADARCPTSSSRLERDYKNVHGDVKRLAELGLIERRKDALVSVAWDVVRAEMRLAA